MSTIMGSASEFVKQYRIMLIALTVAFALIGVTLIGIGIFGVTAMLQLQEETGMSAQMIEYFIQSPLIQETILSSTSFDSFYLFAVRHRTALIVWGVFSLALTAAGFVILYSQTKTAKSLPGLRRDDDRPPVARPDGIGGISVKPPKKMNTCANCGARISEGTKYCPICKTSSKEVSAPLSEPPRKIVYCANCDTRIIDGDKFCIACGAPAPELYPHSSSHPTESPNKKNKYLHTP